MKNIPIKIEIISDSLVYGVLLVYMSIVDPLSSIQQVLFSSLPEELHKLISIDESMFKVLAFVNKNLYSLLKLQLQNGFFLHFYFIEIIQYAIKVNSLNLVEWTFFYNPRFFLPRLDSSTSVFIHRCAVKYGRLDILIWFHQCGIKFTYDDNACCVAAEGGHFELVKWLHLENHLPLKIDFDIRYFSFLHCAAKGGNLEIIQWACSQGAGFSNSADVAFFARNVATNGHIDILKWAWDYSYCKQFKNDFIKSAAEGAAFGGFIHILEWILSLDSTSTILGLDVCTYAATNGHLDTIKWLHSRDFPCLLLDVGIAAAQNGHLNVLIWIYEQDCDLILFCVFSKSHAHIQDWLHRNGCPCSCRRIT